MFTLKLANNRAVDTTVHQLMLVAAVLVLQTIWTDVFHCKLGCGAQMTPLGLCIRLIFHHLVVHAAAAQLRCCSAVALVTSAFLTSMSAVIGCSSFYIICDPTGYQAGQLYSFSSATQSQAVCNCCLRGAHRAYGMYRQFGQGLSCCKSFRLKSPHIMLVEKFLRSLLNTTQSSTTI